MIIPHLAATKTDATAPANTKSTQAGHQQAEIKRAAMEFEAIMLSQLTASMRPETGEGDEEASLTGGQNDLVQQMFGEQLASSLAKSGGIGLAEMLMHQLNPNKDKAAATVSPLERAVEVTRHLRRAEAPSAITPSVTNIISTAPAAGDVASVTNATTSSGAQPDMIEPLLSVSRPRRVSELLNNEWLKTESEPAPDLVPVKLTAPPVAETVKPASTGATPSQPAYKAQSGLDPIMDGLQQVTRPRRFSDVLKSDAPGRTSRVKLPPAALSEAVKPRAVESSARITMTAAASTTATASASPAMPVYTGQPRLDAIIEQASRRHGIDPHLLAAVMHTESGKRQNAVSHKGAAGYMQLMPATFKQFAGPGKNIFDPVTNINTGAAYLKFLSDKYHGNVDKVLAGYNAGIGNVERFGGVPPFKETRNFVASVKRNYRDLLATSKSSAPGVLATSGAASPSGRTVAKLKHAASAEALEAFLTQRPQRAAQPAVLSTRATTAVTTDPIDLQVPLQGRISSAFGASRSHRHHQGIDIAAARGTPIEASASGEVVFSGWTRGYGKTVLIKHQEGTYTRYAHADKLMVSRGDTVQMGQQVATVGSTGHATGPHLHFEIVQGNRRVNPLNVVTDNPTGRIAVKIGK